MAIAYRYLNYWPDMRRISYIALCVTTLFLALYLTSCVSYNAGTNFQMTAVGQLEVGMTTKARVLELFGPPFKRIDAAQYRHQRVHYGDDETFLIWQYAYVSESLVQSSGRFLQVEFDATGSLIDYICSNQFGEGTTPVLLNKSNFDVLLAQRSIIPGKSTRSEVAALLGTDYTQLPFRKPGVSERWHYGYSEVSKNETVAHAGNEKKRSFYKSLNIDFDESGIVRHIKGASDFPDDLAPL